MEMKSDNQTMDEIFQNTTYILARYCMPTLLGQKPATLIHFSKNPEQDNESVYRCFQAEAGQFACQSSLLYENQAEVFLLIYQAELLGNALFQDDVREFLSLFGYHTEKTDISLYIFHFRKRYHDYWEKGSVFPHEIGIFLGYPLKDVESFIINQGKNYQLSGFWKVYHDVPNALETFKRYRMLREKAIQTIMAGNRLEDLRNDNYFIGTNRYK